MNARAPIDPDVKLPPAVARAAAASEAHYAPQPAEPPAPPTIETTLRLVEPPAPTPTPAPAPTAPEPQPAPTPTPAPAPTATDPNDETWEQKFKSVNGRYVLVQQQLKDAVSRIDGLQNVIATMSAAPPAPAPTTPTVVQRVSKEELETFGQEFFDAVGKRAEEVVAPMVAELQTKLEQVNGQLKNTTTANVEVAKQRMMDSLDTQIPPWRQVNEDPKFIAWLNNFDPISGAKRFDLLTEAWNATNTHRVVAIFNGFLLEEAALAPQTPGATLEQPATQPASTKVPLESLAAPGRARTAAPSPAPAEKPIITNAEIQQFYSAVHKGQYKGRDEEKARIEGMIFEAMREGRIRN